MAKSHTLYSLPHRLSLACHMFLPTNVCHGPVTSVRWWLAFVLNRPSQGRMRDKPKNVCVGGYTLQGHSYVRTYLRNRKHVPCFYRVIQTRVEVWENEKCCGNTSHRRVFPQLFRILPNFHECFYNSIETQRTCFLCLLENTAMKNGEITYLLL